MLEVGDKAPFELNRFTPRHFPNPNVATPPGAVNDCAVAWKRDVAMTDAAFTDGPISVGPPGLVGTQRARTSADLFMCKLLRVPVAPGDVDEARAQRLFSGSILLSALRCLLSYIVLPILTPLIGAATSVSDAVGLPIGLLALFFDVRGIRRFWLAGHRQRWTITWVYVAVMGLVLALVIGDIIHLAR